MRDLVSSSWRTWTAMQLEGVRAAGRWREPRVLDGFRSIALDREGRRLVSFASNDYLGLTGHPRVIDAAAEAASRWGSGSGSARLIAGSRPVHHALEAELADWKGQDAAVLFSSGYAANLGVLTSFGVKGALVCSDELNHASIVDGCRLAGADVSVYRHCDVEHLEHLMAGRDRVIVVSDSVFSMDGDVAPLDALGEVCARHGALLVLDEAHSVLGPDPDLDGIDLLRVGTLSKTLAALGGFVAGPADLVDLLVNRARSYIFTTAPTPADTWAALAALGIVRSPEGDTLRAKLASHVERLAPGHLSPIVPVVLGEEGRAIAASEALIGRGILVPAIRPPTVPPGTSRLRVSLSAAHTVQQVEQLSSSLYELTNRVTLGA